MKKIHKKVLVYVLCNMFIFSIMPFNVYGAKDGEIIGVSIEIEKEINEDLCDSAKEREEENEKELCKSTHYINGLPIVRRQVKCKIPKESNIIRRRASYSSEYSGYSDKIKKPWKPKKSNINNIVIFVRFKDEDEFINEHNAKMYMEHYNGNNLSLKSYINDLSYGYFNVQSSLFPINSEGKHYSYETKKPRDCYRPYSSNNLKGYREEDINQREYELLTEVLNSCKPMVENQFPTSDELDFYCDGKLDNIIFVFKGKEDSWKDMLWPHQFEMDNKFAQRNNVQIGGKYLGLYNLMMESSFKQENIGTTVHEFLHTLGYQDLYRYKSNGIPVGQWDLMSIQYPIPQFPLGIPRSEYGALCAPPTDINQGGRYTLYPSTTKDITKTILYKIESPTIDNTNEYFAVEYRASTFSEKNKEPIVIDDDLDLSTDTQYHWDNVLPSEGIIVYRVNKTVLTGNAASDGKENKDSIFIFRPNISNQGKADGDIGKDAALKNGESLGFIDHKNKKICIEPNIEDMIYFSDDTNSGIRIFNLNITNDKVASFNVEFDNTFITKAKLKGAKTTIDSVNKKIIFTLPSKFSGKFIVPEIKHDGMSITPDDGIPIIISDDMKYTVTSPTGKTQIWEVITSPVAQIECKDQLLNANEKAKIAANVINKKGVTYKWYHNGKIIEHITTSEIFIKNPKDNKSHKIYAIAENEAGKLKCACTKIQWKKDVKTSSFDEAKIKHAISSDKAQSFRMSSSYYGVYGASNYANSDYEDLNSESEDIYVVNDGNYEQDFKMYEVVDISEEFNVEEETSENSYLTGDEFKDLDCEYDSTGSEDIYISEKSETSEDVNDKNKQEEIKTEEILSLNSALLKPEQNFNIFAESNNCHGSLLAEIPEGEELTETEKSEKIVEKSESSPSEDEKSLESSAGEELTETEKSEKIIEKSESSSSEDEESLESSAGEIVEVTSDSE